MYCIYRYRAIELACVPCINATEHDTSTAILQAILDLLYS